MNVCENVRRGHEMELGQTRALLPAMGVAPWSAGNTYATSWW